MKDLKLIKPYAEALLQKKGIPSDFGLVRLAGGRNNRVYKLLADENRFVLKHYFSSKEDNRDRLGAEFAFSRFAWANGLRQIPEPLCCDRENNLVLFEFIDGRKLEKNQVEKNHVNQALQFVQQLNQYKDTKEALALPCASEACFSVDNHLSSVGYRMAGWEKMVAQDNTAEQAKHFVKKKLETSFIKLKQKILAAAEKNQIDVKQNISALEKIISPSDFGFHNALLKQGGVLCFLDFEYAGWDDPAKLICDFFCQPDIPAPVDDMGKFIDSLTLFSGEDERRKNIIWRINLLLPLYRIKWCCIMLNDFLRIDARRKQFASFDQDRRMEQLKKTIVYAQQHHVLG